MEQKLIEFAKQNKIYAVENLIKMGVDINFKDEYGNTALHYAVSNNFNSMVDNLLSSKHKIKNIKNKFQITPLQIAIVNKNIGIVTKIISNKPNIKDHIALNLAAENGYTEIFKILLKNNSNHVDKTHLLMCAAIGIINKIDTWDIVKYLLECISKDEPNLLKENFLVEDLLKEYDRTYAEKFRFIVENFNHC